MKPLLHSSLLLAFVAALPAQAMYLNPQGTGQVLMFPYYTANAGQTTLVNLVNTTARAKSLKIEFREGHAGREVMDFFIFLGPYDSWSGVVGSDSDSSAAFVLTRDDSCTAPSRQEWDPAGADAWRVSMRDFAYVDDNEDTGPTDLARTREGYVAVFELAQLSGALAAAVDTDGPRQCHVVRAIDPSNPSLTVPGGGLAGHFAIVDVAQGTLFGGSATAVDDFSKRALYSDTTSLPRYLMWGNSGTQGVVHADVFSGGRLLNLRYRNFSPNNGYDAFSALLAADSLQADITRDASTGSFSEWVLTAPSKWLYTDNQPLGEPLNTTRPGDEPYEEIFGAARPGGSCSRFEASAYDREGNPVAFAPDAPLTGGNKPGELPEFSLCRSTDVVYFGPTPASGATPVLGSHLGVKVWNPQPAFDSGRAILSFAKRNDGTPRLLRPDLHGTRVRGLPLIGFEAIKYVNGNVLPGVLANYAYALPLMPTTKCINEQNDLLSCP